ncbi:MAG TPA: hypothetical protein PK961_16570, partial [bacterium]|nr:hypothetical protein [bacterium]
MKEAEIGRLPQAQSNLERIKRYLFSEIHHCQSIFILLGYLKYVLKRIVMDFKKLIGLETAAAIIGAVIADLVHRYTQLSYSLLIYLAPLLVIAIMLTQIKHRLQIVRSGMQGYYKTLSLDEGFAYWKETETSFGYLGITGASISEYIRGFLHREKDHDMNYRF